MEFFVREFEPAWLAARAKLAGFVGASAGSLIFAENATVAMNIVADSFPLAAGDEVLLTDHEYGAVQRIWQRACEKAGATARTVELPLPLRSAEAMPERIFAAVDRPHAADRRQPHHQPDGGDPAGGGNLPRGAAAGNRGGDRRAACDCASSAGDRRPGLRLLHGELPQVALAGRSARASSMSHRSSSGTCGRPC